MTDVDIKGAVERIGLAIVEGASQIIARDDATGGTDEDFEDVEFERGDFDFAAVAQHLPCAGVEADAIDFEDTRFQSRLSSGTAEDGLHAGEEFVGAEGLGEIVVGAGVQTGYAVVVFSARGEHDYRNGALAADLMEGFEAIQPGHHDVEQDKIKVAFQDARQTLFAIAREGKWDLMAREILGHESGEFRVIVDQKDGNRIHVLLE